MTDRVSYQLQMGALLLMGLLFWSAVGWAAMRVLG
jgi:hypothetical protein